MISLFPGSDAYPAEEEALNAVNYTKPASDDRSGIVINVKFGGMKINVTILIEIKCDLKI